MIAEKQLYCLVCRKKIFVGESYEVYPTNKYSCRHSYCPPKSDCSVKIDEIPKKKASGSAKRRRAKGSGYTGGDGYVDL